MCLDQTNEIDFQQDVRIVHDEGAARKKLFCILKRAAGAEDRVFMKELDTVSISRTAGPFPDHLRLVMQVDAYPAGTDRSELFKNDLDQRFSKNREERFRQVARDRQEPLSETSGGKKYIDWKFRHRILEKLVCHREHRGIKKNTGMTLLF